MKYEIIIFDADETLFDFKKSEKYAFKNAMLEFNIEYDENYHLKIYSDINKAIWKEFEKRLITQEKLKVERFKRLSDKLNLKFDEVKFARSYMKHLANASFLYDDSIPLVESLHKSYKLSIVTNGLTDVQNKRIRKSIIAKYFQDIVISEEVGVSKPDSKIFELALNNIKHTDKSKVLIVGDSLTSDIQGGINSGIDTCWLNSNKIANTTKFKPTYEISNLMELNDILR
ncbi:2-haloalkanoic acid dehalogenase [Clostridium carboxidivorans P7]|uniref:HAD-superfamily hydrolase, subfamily IA, variant 1 n=1 Tax=Clostridium carboxidivorans P7 TaxID=536227 RepID=C6PRX3_9CLOT|nr:YjjG family noncanonical pyrimidine nucleotidase [Clostridium carboxidivorans]AKN30020.1 2-haloalkanoic acid dehalogenase [Clostridium carboxidivorans P7]EET88025.1 HAD-superfamily hydrolase, subfamily IA, variant 1 [Clostridium carboxidivorans P7]EFG89019.1 HAD hydrolase [Clostridium carboxidivorans P7]